MSIPPRLASKLNEVMGPSAAEDLVTWLDGTNAQHAELRADLAELRQEIRASELRLGARLEARLGALSSALTSQLNELSAQLGEKISSQGTELRKEIHAVDSKIERRFSDLLLWSFVFWVGAVGAIAMLARVLRP